MLDIRQMPGHLIRRFNQISVAIFVDRMSRHGCDLTPVQFAAMAALDATPGIDQATLAGIIAYDRVTIGGVIDRLERKKLVLREVSEKDRRARVLRISEVGRKLLSELRPIVVDLQNDILLGLDGDERGYLVELLQKVVAARSEAGSALSPPPARPESILRSRQR